MSRSDASPAIGLWRSPGEGSGGKVPKKQFSFLTSGEQINNLT